MIVSVSTRSKPVCPKICGKFPGEYTSYAWSLVSTAFNITDGSPYVANVVAIRACIQSKLPFGALGR